MSGADVPSPPPVAISRPMATARLKLGAASTSIDVPISVPSDPVLPQEILPAVRRLQNELVSAAEREAGRRGASISCKAGCGACCRQPVPLADAEVEALAELIEGLPEPRRSVVRERFAEAERRLETSGLAEKLRRMGDSGRDDPDVREVANAYFRLGIPCPFLEEESCSIYAERPVICRGYIVTSPSALCTDVSSRDIKTVPVLQLSPAMQSVTAAAASGPHRRWSVMTLLYDWRRRHPPLGERRPGPHWIGALLRALQRGAP